MKKSHPKNPHGFMEEDLKELPSFFTARSRWLLVYYLHQWLVDCLTLKQHHPHPSTSIHAQALASLRVQIELDK